MNKFSVFVSWSHISGVKRFRIRPCSRGLTVVFVTLLLVITGCAVNTLQQQTQQTPSIVSPSVLALYNEGAAFFQKQDFERARERYQAALEQARMIRDELGIGVSLAGIGAAHQGLKQYSQALESYSASLQYFRKYQIFPAKAAEGIALAATGEVQLQQGNAESAIEAFDEALAIGQRLLTKASEEERILVIEYRAKLLGQKAEAHRRLGQAEEAIRSYEAAATDLRAAGKLNLVGLALWGAGNLHSHTGAQEKAEKAYSQALAIFQELGDVNSAINVWLGLGAAQVASGKFNDAVKTLTSLIEAAEYEGRSDVLTETYRELGQAFEGLSEFGSALQNYEAFIQRLRGSDRSNKLADESTALVHMGKISRWLSQYEKAIEYFRLAMANYRTARNLHGEADVLMQLGEVFAWLGDFESARQYYKQALDTYKSDGNLHKQIETLAALAETTARLGHNSSDDISKYLTEAENLHETLINRAGIDLKALWGKRPAIMQGGYEEADLQYARDFQSQKQLLNYPQAAAEVRRQMRTAAQFYREWKSAAPSLGQEYLSAVGNLFQKWGILGLWWGDTEEALRALFLAQVLHTSIPLNREVAIEWAKDWYFMGEAYRRLKNLELALFYFDMAGVLAWELKTPEIHWVFAGVARTLADMGRPDEAVSRYKLGLEIFESIQGQQETEEVKIDVLEGASYVYRDFVALLLKMYKQTGDDRYLQDAFQYTEAGKARAFLAMLGKSRFTRLSGKAGTSAVDEESIRNQFVQLQHRLQSPKLQPAEESVLLKELETLRKGWQDIQRQTAQKNPQYGELFFPQLTTAAKVQSILGTDTAFLEYANAPEGSTLWVITKDQIRAYTLPDQDAKSVLEEYIKTLREPLMESSEVQRHAVLGKQLYQILLGPANDQIRGKKQLIIAPDGLLYYLPFEALIIPSQTGQATRSLADNHYLIKEYAINYVPSASVLVTQLSEQRAKDRTSQLPLLAFGDPVYPTQKPSRVEDTESTQLTNIVLRGVDLDRLKFSREEVIGIARVFGIPPTSDHINLEERATMQRLRELDLSQYRILHFAVHGILSDEVTRTTQPALVLSQSGKNDSSNLLQFSDILQMKLNADLVVLSACNTGLGGLREGEGIVGLTRAFLYAGASSTIVSLWKVEDQSTSLLMVHFYQNLKRGLSKADALRQAKLDTMRTVVDLKATGTRQTLAAPFFWAPFILVGDSGPMAGN